MSSNTGSNGRNDVDRRLAFLEKVYLEDRERWRRFEARLDKHEKVLGMLLKQIQKDRKESEQRWQESEQRWQESAQRWQESAQRWQESAQRWQKNDERIDAVLKILRRRMDG